MTVLIRAAAPEDVDRLVALRLENARVHADLDPVRHRAPGTVAARRHFAAVVAGSQPGAHVLVADDGGEVVGMTEVIVNGAAPDHQIAADRVTGQVHTVVLPGRRGLGAGAALVAAAERLAAELGVQELRAPVLLANEAAARFYGAHGYDAYGTLLGKPLDVEVRTATVDDIAAVCGFGATHIPAHYAPLIGDSAAQAQVHDWWNERAIARAVAGSLLVLAESAGAVVGVGQRGRLGADHVVYKLYVHPAHRGRGLGPRLLAELIAALPHGTSRILVEHVAANERAAAFYEREGFRVERVEPSASGDTARDQVWRARALIPDPG